MNNFRKIFIWIFVFLFLAGCGRPTLFKETMVLMDTFVDISCLGPDRKTALKATDEAFKEISRIEKLFSRYDEASEVSKINRLAGIEELVIPLELFKIIQRSIHYSKLSGDNFDITVAPLVDVWKFARNNGSIPDDETVTSALGHVGYKNIVMDEKRLSISFLDKSTKIDLGGIAKGYAADRAKEVLAAYGIKNALINIGGNIFAIGNPLGKKSWQIGIQDPRDKNEVIYRLDLKDRAISTSGDYERPFHIIDPINGRPVEGIMSVTVVSDSAETSDILSTAVFVMGIEKGLNLIKSLKGVEVFIIDKDAKVIKYP